MKAVGKYIVINPIKETNTKTKGGLILAEKQREDVRYRQAEVLVVGEAVEAIKTKDQIYYDKAAGFNIEIKKQEYKVIKEQDVVIVL
jgi:co-chaperonin GroES (HSP10)